MSRASAGTRAIRGRIEAFVVARVAERTFDQRSIHSKGRGAQDSLARRVRAGATPCTAGSAPLSSLRTVRAPAR